MASEAKPKVGMTYELAGIGTRFVALVIDGIILNIVGNVLFPGEVLSGLINFVIGVAYFWFFLTRNNGQTIGSMLLKIRVIRTDGQPLQDADAVIRYIVSIVSGVIIGLGYIWALFDSENQTWHDKIARTYVVRAD